jgi:hypothetical protein
MSSSLRRLESILQLLESWGWQRTRLATRFYIYAPPGSDASGFELLVPRNTSAIDFERALDNCIDAIASYSGLPFNSVETLLLPSAEVIAVRLQGEGFSGGAAPLPWFERTLEHLKRTITRTASLILTDDPLLQVVPTLAQKFLSECWFLQTARGSFVTRVALPTAGFFASKQYSLFVQPREKREVSDTLRTVSALLGNQVLAGHDEVFTESNFQSIRSTLSVGILQEFSKLLRGSQADRVDLSFNRSGDESVIQMPALTDERLLLLDKYVSFVRDQFHEPLVIDASGRVFEVRRARRGGKNSLVGLEAVIAEKPEYITFRIEQEHLHVMLDHFHSGLPIRVRGTARRLRTQIRIEENFQFED